MARPEKIKTPLAQRLTDVRKALGYPTRAPFAKILGIPADTLGTYERGDREPDSAFFAIYMRRFAVNLGWLIAHEGEMFNRSGMPRPPSSEGAPLDEWLMEELGKVAEREHRDAGQKLPAARIAAEAAALYNELLGLVRDIADHQAVEALLPVLAGRLRERLRDAASHPGTGKREAS